MLLGLLPFPFYRRRSTTSLEDPKVRMNCLLRNLSLVDRHHARRKTIDPGGWRSLSRKMRVGRCFASCCVVANLGDGCLTMVFTMESRLCRRGSLTGRFMTQVHNRSCSDRSASFVCQAPSSIAYCGSFRAISDSVPVQKYISTAGYAICAAAAPMTLCVDTVPRASRVPEGRSVEHQFPMALLCSDDKRQI